MRRTLEILALVIVFSALGCKSDPPKPGEVVSFETVCDPKYDPTEEKGRSVTKRVTLGGYLGAPRMMLCTDTCSLGLYPTPERKDGKISVAFKLGDEANQLQKLPKNFSESDIKLRTKENKVVGVGAKIRVTGRRLGTKKDNTCQIVGIDLIESA